MESAYDAARRYLAGGLSVVPVAMDGSKAPTVAWKQYQTERPTLATVASWYSHGPLGVAILGGIASGGLEVVDFDCFAAWEKWRVIAHTLLDAEGETLPRLPVVRTPSNGRHLYYRHTGEQQGNAKLAKGIRDGKEKTLAETRGANGYVQAPGCPAACHPTGRLYELLRGDLGDVPTITPNQRAILLDAARTLSEVTEPDQVSATRPRGSDGTRPGDIYMARASWDALLRRHGWRKVAQHGDTGMWRRPGKERGISATVNYGGTGNLIVFSTNARPFDAGRAYSLFSAYGLLDHGGDFSAAAHALKEAGYVVATPPTITPAREQNPACTTDDLLRLRLAGARY